MPTRNYAVLDFETTGFDPNWDRIIEVGAVRVQDGQVVASFAELLDPGIRIPYEVTQLTGITQAMVRGKPRPEVVMPRLRAFLGDCPCVAHNASFDKRFFDAEMARAGQAHDRMFLCSMLLARRLVRQAPNHQLGTLVRHLGLPEATDGRLHRALADVQVTQALWHRMGEELRQRIGGRHPELPEIRGVIRKPKAGVERYLESLAAVAATPKSRRVRPT